MPYQVPLRRQVKSRAKRLMLNLLSLRVTLVVVGAQMAFFFLRILCNGTLRLTMANLASYGDTASGVYVLEEGINVIFRMDLTGTVAALSMTYSQIGAFLIINAILFLLLSPLRLGAMEAYWKVTRGDGGKVAEMFRWFLEKGRLLKSWAVEFCLQILVGVLTFIASTPGLFLFYRFYSTATSMTAIGFSQRLMLWAADGLAILAMLFGVWLHSLLLPVRYCLASHPEYTLRETFRRGLRSASGIRGGMYRFRLSYILWFFASRVTYGAMDIFVLPYSSLGSMLFLQQAAKWRKAEERQGAASVPAEEAAPEEAEKEPEPPEETEENEEGEDRYE